MSETETSSSSAPPPPSSIPIEAKPLPNSQLEKTMNIIIPFCVSLPTNLHHSYYDEDSFQMTTTTTTKQTKINTKNNNNNASAVGSSSSSSKGVVGTITIANTSAVIWFGWGTIVPKQNVVKKKKKEDEEEEEEEEQMRKDQIGKGLPQMGPLVVSMPRTKYSSSNTNSSSLQDAPSSQLIGGSNEEDMMTGWQMSSRLSKKIGWPIFVSCAIHSDLGSGGGGGGGGASAGSAGIGGNEGGVGGGGMEGLGAGFGGLLSQQAAALAEKEIGRILMEEKNKKKTLVM